MRSSYKRVLPRDLFHEAKLLKCLGQLALLQHDNNLPIRIIHRDEHREKGFLIVQDTSDGAFACANLRVFRERPFCKIDLYLPHGDRDHYPLLFRNPDDPASVEERVFNEQGQLTTEFKEFIGYVQE